MDRGAISPFPGWQTGKQLLGAKSLPGGVLSTRTFSNSGNLEGETLFVSKVSTELFLHTSPRVIERHYLGVVVWGGLEEATQRSPGGGSRGK